MNSIHASIIGLSGLVFGILVVYILKQFISNTVPNNQTSHFPSTLELYSPASYDHLSTDYLLKRRSQLVQQIQSLDSTLLRRNQNLQVALPPPNLQNSNTTIEVDEVNRQPKPSSDNLHQVLETPKITDNTKPVCKYNFKVYIYPIPKSLAAFRFSEEARRNGTLHICRKCILEQFSLEYIINDYFHQFCGRTENPDEADYFYLPFVRDAEYRVTLESRTKHSRAPSIAEQALLTIMEKNDSNIWKRELQITDKYWHRNHGADHIIVMPAPVTNLRHESSKRGFFHYMIHLQSPIFLGLEFSKSYVEEYPICSAQKNIVMPYPTTDPDLYNGKLLTFPQPRNSLLYYAGGLHGDCIEVRRAMRNLMVNSTKLAGVIPSTVHSNMVEREHGFLAATFCPVPIGDSPSSKRMYDVLNFGCIPVILSDDLVWAYSDQTGGHLNHSNFSIQMPQSVIQYTIDRTLRRYSNSPESFGYLPSGISLYNILKESFEKDSSYESGVYVNPLVRILRRVPQADVDHLRKHGKVAAASYRYYQMNPSMNEIPTSKYVFPDGGAMDELAEELQERKEKGISKIGEECYQEAHKRKHKYIGRYTCDVEKVESLIRRKRRRL
jgi:hypothetical protein